MTTTATTTSTPLTLNAALAAFLRALAGRNRSAGTLRAYRTGVGQFLAWLERYQLERP